MLRILGLLVQAIFWFACFLICSGIFVYELWNIGHLFQIW